MGNLFLKYISDRSVAILTIVPDDGANGSSHVCLCSVSATQKGKSISSLS